MKRPGKYARKAWKKFSQMPGAWDYSKNDWASETPKRPRKRRASNKARKRFWLI